MVVIVLVVVVLFAIIEVLHVRVVGRVLGFVVLSTSACRLVSAGKLRQTCADGLLVSVMRMAVAGLLASGTTRFKIAQA